MFDVLSAHQLTITIMSTRGITMGTAVICPLTVQQSLSAILRTFQGRPQLSVTFCLEVRVLWAIWVARSESFAYILPLFRPFILLILHHGRMLHYYFASTFSQITPSGHFLLNQSLLTGHHAVIAHLSSSYCLVCSATAKEFKGPRYLLPVNTVVLHDSPQIAYH